MNRPLDEVVKPPRRITDTLYHYDGDKRRIGPRSGLRGDCSGLRGNCSGLWGGLNYRDRALGDETLAMLDMAEKIFQLRELI